MDLILFYCRQNSAYPVPALNPIDPTLVNPDPKLFATNLDLFLEHGSVPSGDAPMILMPPFGDSKMFTDQQMADVIAYMMSLSGVTWTKCPGRLRLKYISVIIDKGIPLHLENRIALPEKLRKK